MTLSQNYQLLTANSCVIVAGPDTPPPSAAGSPPLIINSATAMHQHQLHHHMMGKRPIAPALDNHPVSTKNSNNPVIRFSGSDVKNTCGSKTSSTTSSSASKRMQFSHLSQYTTGPLPSVERRNARERNRVKQVNNGFDKLRQHIPPKIVEVENGGRGVSKKLSKVDTLRLAVKYIQRLKEMLDENNNRLHSDTPASSISTTGSLSTTSSALSYYSASPAPSNHHHHMQVAYSSTPVTYQENHHLPTCSEPSVSPTPSYHSDVSSNHHHPQIYHQMPNAQGPFTSTGGGEDGGAYPQAAYDQMAFVDEDSGSFEEDGILDDILHWQLQN